MQVIGVELLTSAPLDLKFLLNESGIVFFPAAQQHRDVKMRGLIYEDDYRGNAVAGIISGMRVEIRYHTAFSEERIRRLWFGVSKIPEIAEAGLGPLAYQGREIR